MAKLDPLLQAIVDNRMDALVLEPERLPRLVRGTSEHEVTRVPLDGNAIHLLVTEVAPTGEAPSAGDDGNWRFEYRKDDQVFRFAVVRGDAGWSARAEPAATGVEAPTAGGDAAPRPAPSPAPGPAAPPIPIPTAPATAPPAPATEASPAPATEASPPVAAAGASIPGLEELLVKMLEADGSDLHLSTKQAPRIRVDGDLAELPGYAVPGSHDLEQLLLPIIPERNREELEATNDADFAYEIPGRARFRVNAFRDRMGLGMVLRQIPHKIPTFEELGVPEVLRSLAYLSKGLVLVTGPTGSGKSTTQAAIIDLINRSRHDHIITIEDPIEFVHSSRKCMVNQREVGVHTSSFKRALRAALREDPDIILVGEMRDLETISIAIETAETGHLVFGTLHTTTAPSTVERLVDQFPGDRQAQIRVMLADSLRAVIAQTLLKRIGGGRVAAFEILMCTPAVSNLIREGKTYQIASAMQTGKKQGMITLNDSLFDLVEKKIVTPEEAYFKAIDKVSLEKKLTAAGIRLQL